MEMEKRKIDNIVEKYYSEIYLEDNRFEKRANKTEFITTTKYIDKYLKLGDKVLEVGAGTGAYSIYYAKKGYSVDAIELVESNLDFLRSKITKDMNIRAIQGNAIDLSAYKDNTFDVTLVLGPLYHLFDDEEVKKAVEEAIRVTKKNGKIYFAFVLADSTFINWGFKNKNIYGNIGTDRPVSLDYKPNNSEELIFNLRYFDEIKELLNGFDINILHYVASDGVSVNISETLEEMTEEEYNVYLGYHLSICERTDLIGYSAHLLAICEK